MKSFLLYLFESGLCLSILYSVYYLFFRKETYFNFIRFYLLGIIVISLLIPLVHFNISVFNIDTIKAPIGNIASFRTYYTDFIALSETEFGNLPYTEYEAAEFEDSQTYINQSYLKLEEYPIEHRTLTKDTGRIKLPVNPFLLFMIIYLTGVLFYFARFVFLIVKLARTIKRGKVEKYNNYKLVLMEEELPPFSFFKYIFINKNAIKLKQFEQVMVHEQVHVVQRHSSDLIIAHAISIFQWFNPLVWYLQKAIKTTHEYIADDKVVNKGFELFDYQSLLLSQLVSIQSVVLVNNFNLISIKKRIMMMTKDKSRFTAKLKALFIIPVAIFTFFIFADMTFISPIMDLSNYSTVNTSKLNGIWLNADNDTFGKLLLFENNKLSVLESVDNVGVVELDVIIKDRFIEVKRFRSPTEQLKYVLSGETIKIWWTDTEYSTYSKTESSNSFNALKNTEVSNIDLPIMDQTKILDKPEWVYNIYVLSNKYYVDDMQCSLSTLSKTIEKRVGQFNKISKPYLTARIVVDKDAEMKPVYDLFQILREMRLYKIAYATLPVGDVSKLQYHLGGIPQMLPPTESDGAKILDRDEVGDNLLVLYPTKQIDRLGNRFSSFIQAHPKYIAVYEWQNSTSYGSYVQVTNMYYDVIYNLRTQYTQEKYNLAYQDVPKNIQKEARKKYPMRITQKNTDED